MSDKTESPTPRRLRRAQKEGDSPVSAALIQAISFMTALALVPAVLGATAQRAAELVRTATSQPAPRFSATALILDVLLLSAPLILAAAAAAYASGIVQTGGVVAFGKLSPDLGRANPVTGLKQLWRAERLVSLLRALSATLLTAWLATVLVGSELAALAAGVGQLGEAVAAGLVVAQRLGWVAALVGLGLAAGDVLATRHSWFERLRMSRDEVKREHREAEGDPELKGARTRAHREVLAGASLNAIKDATVVIVNPTHLATALRYDEDRDDAPKVISQGAGDLARKIVEAAHAYGVPVVRDVPVARALSELEVGEEIPEALYEAVAEVLREVYDSERAQAGHDEPAP